MIEPGVTSAQITQYANLLYSVAFFNIFSLEELAGIVSEARLMKWKRFAAGYKVFGEGEFDQHFYILLQGKVDIRRKMAGQEEEQAVGQIGPGELFGEMVVTNPAVARRASAYATKGGPVVLCEVDATLIDTVSLPLKVKFQKKFLDLILNRINSLPRSTEYYQALIKKALAGGGITPSEFFHYSMETAATEKSRQTQLVKYTDFLIAKKLSPEKGSSLLANLMIAANKELDATFHST